MRQYYKSGGVATKRDPAKWAAAKSRAKAKMGGKHSARAMQLATKYYKDEGGTYKGKKKSSNKLSKWTKQKWRTKSGKPSSKTDHESKAPRDCCRETVRKTATEDSKEDEKV